METRMLDSNPAGGRIGLVPLAAAGLVGLIVWEFWARVVSPPAIGGPIEPGALVLSFARYRLGWDVPRAAGEAFHIVAQVLLFPLAYVRLVRRARWPAGIALDILFIAAFVAFVTRELIQGEDLPTGIMLGFVLVLFALVRPFNPSRLYADAASFGAATWFLSLAVIAPLSGLPFMLLDWGGQLSFMSFLGHTLYGVAVEAALSAHERRRT